MIIDTRKNILKHNLKQTEINNKEKKLILLLSDNKYHSIGEIRRYLKYITNLQVRILINQINHRLKNNWRVKLIQCRKNKHNFTGRDLYRTIYTIGITY